MTQSYLCIGKKKKTDKILMAIQIQGTENTIWDKAMKRLWNVYWIISESKLKSCDAHKFA